MNRRHLVLAFLAWLFLSHFFKLFLKLSMGSMSTQLTAALPFLMLAAILLALLVELSHDRSLAIRDMNIMDLLVFIYLALMVIQIFNPNLRTFRMGLYGMLDGGMWIVAYFLARSLIATTVDAKSLIWAIATTSILGALYALFAVCVGFRTIEADFAREMQPDNPYLAVRGVGTLAQPFALALMCAMAFPCALVANLSSKRILQSIFLLGGVLALIVGVIISGSRVTMLALPAVVIALAALLLTGRISRAITKLLAIQVFFRYLPVFGLLIGTFLYTVISGHFEYQAERIFSITEYETESSVSVRYEVWSALLQHVEKNPLGYGTGALGTGASQYGPILGIYTVADNQFVATAVESGLIGLALLLAIFIFQGIFYLRVCKHDMSGITVAALLGSVVMITTGMAADSLKVHPGNLFFGALLGAFSAYYSRKSPALLDVKRRRVLQSG